MADVLSDILETIALKASVYFRTDFRPPFGVQVPAYARAARFHIVIQGSCQVRLVDGSAVTLSAGDLVLVPNGSPHVLTSGETNVAMTLDDAFAAASFAGTGPFVLGDGPESQGCHMVCGHFNFAEGADHPLLHALPDSLHITAAERAARPMLDDIVRLVSRRMFAGEVGSVAVVSRLSEILFIEIVQAVVNQAPDVARLMSAVHDPQIGLALSLFHDDVATNWTVDSLAKSVAMSRSRFAERFHTLVGTAPMAYVHEWRMQRALKLLNLRTSPVKLIATRVGYRSAAAFSRAFAERFGASPAQYLGQKNGRES
ncbi:MAG: AraC family transcriptional regulator [Sphingomonadaceae bacterium]